MDEYRKLLEAGMKKISKIESKRRFEVPKSKVMISGNKTIFNNFYELADALRRDPQHLLKFLLKELATSVDMREKKIIFIGNFTHELVDKKIDIYVKSYVICPECGKPDTKLLKEERNSFLVCEACGARQIVARV
jgi:translation initiation factor 2 subunit 2